KLEEEDSLEQLTNTNIEMFVSDNINNSNYKDNEINEPLERDKIVESLDNIESLDEELDNKYIDIEKDFDNYLQE
ncbi:10083_t:CDS:2, partial [Scutellospora calospora]